MEEIQLNKQEIDDKIEGELVGNVATPILPATFPEIISDAEILARLTSLGFTIPTDVQSQTVPAAMSGRDLIVQAKTGSGKTFAFALPIVMQMRAKPGNKDETTALVITPTRELAMQIRTVVSSLVDDIKPVLVIGGADADNQLAELKQDPRFVVGTPGRILDFIKQKALRLNHCRFFVLDEADEMLSMGFIDDVRAILSRLPDRRQGLFVSATISPRVEMLAHSFLTKPERIIVASAGEDAPQIEHCYCEVGGDLMAKPNALCDIIETYRPRSAIIFCNTKSDTSLVEVWLRRRGFDARRINSDLTQAQRDRIMRKIRAQELQFLVATDIAARGIDIEQIDLVVNYTVHEQSEAYVHRTGRTGRAGRFGRAITLVGPRDIGFFHHLTKVLDIEFKKLPLPTDAEITSARQAHLYEMLRLAEMTLTERDLMVASGVIQEVGGGTEPSEEFVNLMAKLLRYASEHFLTIEASSLEDELDKADAKAESKEGAKDTENRDGKDRRDNRRENDREQRPRHRDDQRDDRDSRQGRDYNDRREDDRRSRDRSGDRGVDRRGDERDRERSARDRDSRDRGRDYDNRPENRSNDQREYSRDRNDDRRGRDRRDSRDRGGNDDRRQSAPRKRPEDAIPRHGDVRLYIGQGNAHGMTDILFKELAQEFAGVDSGELKKLSLRDHYGYLDVDANCARALVGSLNGIEYNGHPLPVEFASVLVKPQARREGTAPTLEN